MRCVIYSFSADIVGSLHVGEAYIQKAQLSVLEVESLKFSGICHRLPGLLECHFRGVDGKQIVLMTALDIVNQSIFVVCGSQTYTYSVRME